MKFDVFLSICQTEVNGYMPTERMMWENFFDQVQLADELGYGTAWVAETHLSTEVQKQNPNPVVPHFKGEIGLNTDILQLAHKVFAKTKRIHVGSAIRNILCNGGPIAHAEAIKTFLSLHGLDPEEKRKLNIGFASGRFEFSNRPYGIVPRDPVEQAAWPVLKSKILAEATEIFLRLLKGEVLSSDQVTLKRLKPEDFREPSQWEQVLNALAKRDNTSFEQVASIQEIVIPPYWVFDKVGVIPREISLDQLNLILGSHDPALQQKANEYLPVAVFNLSITPPEVIEQTHQRMQKCYHSDGGPWQRHFMPRTCQVFLDATPGLSPEEQSQRSLEMAQSAWQNFWKAMEGTLDTEKVAKAVKNSIAGNADEVAAQIKEKYHPEDRLMLWFDFNNHDNEGVKRSMTEFMEKVAPQLG